MKIKFKLIPLSVTINNLSALGLFTRTGRQEIEYFTDAATITLSDLEPLQLNFSPSERL